MKPDRDDAMALGRPQQPVACRGSRAASLSNWTWPKRASALRTCDASWIGSRRRPAESTYANARSARAERSVGRRRAIACTVGGPRAPRWMCSTTSSLRSHGGTGRTARAVGSRRDAAARRRRRRPLLPRRVADRARPRLARRAPRLRRPDRQGHRHAATRCSLCRACRSCCITLTVGACTVSRPSLYCGEPGATASGGESVNARSLPRPRRGAPNPRAPAQAAQEE